MCEHRGVHSRNKATFASAGPKTKVRAWEKTGMHVGEKSRGSKLSDGHIQAVGVAAVSTMFIVTPTDSRSNLRMLKETKQGAGPSQQNQDVGSPRGRA